MDQTEPRRWLQSYNLARETIQTLARLAAQEQRPKSYIVDDAVREYAERHTRQGEDGSNA